MIVDLSAFLMEVEYHTCIRSDVYTKWRPTGSHESTNEKCTNTYQRKYSMNMSCRYVQRVYALNLLQTCCGYGSKNKIMTQPTATLQNNNYSTALCDLSQTFAPSATSKVCRCSSRSRLTSASAKLRPMLNYP